MHGPAKGLPGLLHAAGSCTSAKSPTNQDCRASHADAAISSLGRVSSGGDAGGSSGASKSLLLQRDRPWAAAAAPAEEVAAQLGTLLAGLCAPAVLTVTPQVRLLQSGVETVCRQGRLAAVTTGPPNSKT